MYNDFELAFVRRGWLRSCTWQVAQEGVARELGKGEEVGDGTGSSNSKRTLMVAASQHI